MKSVLFKLTKEEKHIYLTLDELLANYCSEHDYPARLDELAYFMDGDYEIERWGLRNRNM